MTIQVTAGWILVQFAEGDWRYRGALEPGGATSVIAGIKELGHYQRNPSGGFMYDPDTKTWQIKDTPANSKHIEALKLYFLTDAKQENLFQE